MSVAQTFLVYIWRLEGNIGHYLQEHLKHADNILRKLGDLILAITALFQGKAQYMATLRQAGRKLASCAELSSQLALPRK